MGFVQNTLKDEHHARICSSVHQYHKVYDVELGVRVDLNVPATSLKNFVKLPHDATWTMEEGSSEHFVHGRTSVGWHLPAAAPKLSLWGRLY